MRQRLWLAFVLSLGSIALANESYTVIPGSAG